MAGGAGRQSGFQQAAQGGDVPPYDMGRAGGRAVAPQRVEDLTGGHGPARMRQEQGEQGTLLGEAEVEFSCAAPHPHRAQHLEPDRAGFRHRFGVR